MPINDDLHQQLVKDLLIESNEGLDRFDREMLVLEKGEGTPETLNVIFRVIHTIKGTAGCLGLSEIESVAHVGENLLDALRGGKLTVTPELITALLAYTDALRLILNSLQNTKSEGPADYSRLLQQLQDLQNGSAALPSSTLPPPPPPASPAQAASGEKEGPTRSQPVSNSAIRVNVDQLDKLMNLVGELVLARNQIVQYSPQVRDNLLVAASQRLSSITTELQESVMKTRLQPIGNIWAKFPRVVRDLAHELGKNVRLVMEGKETDLDRTIIEAIKDPLIHLVRNAIDHGIEGPEARRAAGKPEEGLLLLRALHEGGQVNIDIMDDGRGINVPRVKQKALEQGLITTDQAQRMGEREAFNLIFLPGFSTAEKITHVSGRGVGMDVVKANIEKIGGSVHVRSEDGAGTTIKIKIPLTLAIIPALIVTSGGQRFAIPQVSLVELVRLEAGQALKEIEMLFGAPVYRRRGQLLPLACLNKELELDAPNGSCAGRDANDPPATNAAWSASGLPRGGDAVNIVVLQADGRQFGLMVDEINDTGDIVVKPLGKQLKEIACFAGATIMGDGRVALILDVLGLAQHANVVNKVRGRPLWNKVKPDPGSSERQALLVFDVGNGGRMALPLSMVARLEEFPRHQVERSGAQEVVQYRGQILPLIHVSRYVNAAAGADAKPTELMPVVVYSDRGRSVGLVVGAIRDIVEEAVTVKRHALDNGILGSAVIQGKVTDLLDVSAVIRAADPAFYANKPVVPLAA